MRSTWGLPSQGRLGSGWFEGFNVKDVQERYFDELRHHEDTKPDQHQAAKLAIIRDA